MAQNSPEETAPTHTLLEMPFLDPVADYFRVYAHPLRLRILDFIVASPRPRQVKEIIAVSEGVQQAIVSQQLRLLRESGILKAERRGNAMFYALAHPRERELLQYVRQLAQDLAPHTDDLADKLLAE
jgi:DNA-binding transcriptional ArsR family regulator